jgi:hypothetical protein
MSPRGGARPNAGRKANKEANRRSHNIKFSDAEWSLVRELAGKAGFRSVSEYIRTTSVIWP